MFIYILQSIYKADHVHGIVLVMHWLVPSLIARFMGPTWGPPGADRTRVGPMWATCTMLSGMGTYRSFRSSVGCYKIRFIQYIILSGNWHHGLISRLRSPTKRVFVQQHVRTEIKKIKGPNYWPFAKESTGDRWHLNSSAPASRLLTEPFVQAQIKENIKTPHYWSLWGKFTGSQ